jgi:hypothetical protein
MKKCCKYNFTNLGIKCTKFRKSRKYRDWLRAGRSGDRISVGARFYAPVQTGSGATQAPVQWVPGLFCSVIQGLILHQDRQCTCNMTYSRVSATIASVEKQYYIFWVRVLSLTFSVCNTHAPYCHLWPDRLHKVLPRYLKKGMIFRKKNYRERNTRFWVSLQILSETLIILRRNERDMIKNV